MDTEDVVYIYVCIRWWILKRSEHMLIHWGIRTLEDGEKSERRLRKGGAILKCGFLDTEKLCQPHVVTDSCSRVKGDVTGSRGEEAWSDNSQS